MAAPLTTLASPLACLAALGLAYAGFMAARALRFLIDRRQGWLWVSLAGVPVVLSWLVGDQLHDSLLVPLLATPLYMLSLLGLAPDDSVLARRASGQALWFRRGLGATVAATVAGIALWTVVP